MGDCDASSALDLASASAELLLPALEARLAGHSGGLEMAIEIQGLDHVVLRVTSVERALRFYCDVLGCRRERHSEALGLYQLRAGSHLVDLVDVASPLGRLGGGAAGESARNMDHFALQLARFDEAEIRAYLAAHGVEPGEVALRYGAQGSGPSMYIRDPDGNVVELKGPPQESQA